MSFETTFNPQTRGNLQLPLTWATAPDEILVHLFSSFKPIDLITAAKTCKNWHWVSQDNAIWTALFKRYFPNVDISKLKTSQLQMQLLQMDKMRRNILRNVCSVTPFRQGSPSNFVWGRTQFGAPTMCVLKAAPITIPGFAQRMAVAIEQRGGLLHFLIENPTRYYITATTFHLDSEISSVHAHQDIVYLGNEKNLILLFRVRRDPFGVPDGISAAFAAFSGHTNTITSLQSWKDMLVSGSRDCSIRLWNSSGQCEDILTDHMNPIKSLCVSEDLLFSGDLKGNIKVWDLNTRKCIDTFSIISNSPVPAVHSLKFERPFLYAYIGALVFEEVKVLILEGNELELLQTIFRNNLQAIAIQNGCLAIASKDDNDKSIEILMDFGKDATIQTTLQDIVDCLDKSESNNDLLRRVEQLDGRIKNGIYRCMDRVLLEEKIDFYQSGSGEAAFHGPRYNNAQRVKAVKLFMQELHLAAHDLIMS